MTYNQPPEPFDPYRQPPAAGPQPTPQFPQYGAPRYEAPQSEAPRYDAPQAASPEYGAPGYAAPQYGAPRYGSTPNPFGPIPGTNPYAAPDPEALRPVPRPGYVTASVVLQWIGGVFTVLAGIFLLLGGLMFSSAEDMRNSSFMNEVLKEYPDFDPDDFEAFAVIIGITGAIVIAIGIAFCVVAYFVGVGRNWARITASVFAIGIGVLGMSAVVPLVWAALIVIFLWLPACSAYFGEKYIASPYTRG